MARLWTSAEDAMLREAAREGPIRPAAQRKLAAKLERSTAAVAGRAFLLGLLERRPRARGPRSLRPPAPERVEREARPIADDGKFGVALCRAAADGRESPPALVPDLRPGTRFPTRWTPPVERVR